MNSELNTILRKVEKSMIRMVLNRERRLYNITAVFSELNEYVMKKCNGSSEKYLKMTNLWDISRRFDPSEATRADIGNIIDDMTDYILINYP